MPPAAALTDAGRQGLLYAINQAGVQQCYLTSLLGAEDDAMCSTSTRLFACITGILHNLQRPRSAKELAA